MKENSLILDKAQINQKIIRLSWEIYEDNYNEDEIVLVGIEKRGVQLSKRISNVLNSISKIKVNCATISLNKENPHSSKIDLKLDNQDIINKVIILVDDVLNSGKTLIYATNQFLSVPVKRISTVVLVDRNHNNFPIKADYVGVSLSTTLQEHISVIFGKQEGVYLS